MQFKSCICIISGFSYIYSVLLLFLPTHGEVWIVGVLLEFWAEFLLIEAFIEWTLLLLELKVKFHVETLIY